MDQQEFQQQIGNITSRMKTKAVRIYGKNDLRLEEFELPPMQEMKFCQGNIRSLCMSTYKAARLGSDHSAYLMILTFILQSLDMNFQAS